jgi:hypothetical protein
MRLEDIHAMFRTHVTPDGYKWRIESVNDGTGFVGLIYRPLDVKPSLTTVTRLTHHQAEKDVIRLLAADRYLEAWAAAK